MKMTKQVVCGLLAAVVMGLVGVCTPTVQADSTTNPVPGRLALIREHVQAMRDAIADFHEAREAGDKVAAVAAVAKAQKLWESLPPRVKERIETNHPGTAQRVANLNAEPPARTTVGTATITKDGNTVTIDKSVTGPNGKTATSDATFTKNGNTVTEDKTITGPNGGVTQVNGTITKDGNTVTDDKTITGPNGKTATSDATWTKDGNTVTEDKTITGPKGGVTQVDGTYTKDGNTITGDKTITGPNGKTTNVDSTRTRVGNTINSSRTVTGAYRGRHFADDLDIFGEREERAGRK